MFAWWLLDPAYTLVSAGTREIMELFTVKFYICREGKMIGKSEHRLLNALCSGVLCNILCLLAKYVSIYNAANQSMLRVQSGTQLDILDRSK
jgi:formate/nitrite transporter FocA (FNT family)